MFAVGSYVIYRAEGVCKISDIREESFGAIGEKAKYYILSPLNDGKSTVFVPIDNERLCSMIRKLLSADEINELVASVKDRRIEWVPDSRGRSAKFREVLATGDRTLLIALINTVLEYWDSGNRVLGTDENAVRRAKRMLYDEFSETAEIASEDDVIRLIRGQLKLSPKNTL